MTHHATPTAGARRLPTILVLLTLMLGAGCASYQDETRAIRAAWIAGDNTETARLAERASRDKAKSVDAVVFLLEEASAWRAAGDYNQSDQVFDEAALRIAEFDARAEVRLAESFSANFTNLSYLPYTGYAYDRVMLHTYKALNAMKLGAMENARVELNRALEAQREAVRQNAQRIEAARKAEQEAASQADTNDKAYDVARARENPRFNAALEQAYRPMRQFIAYSDYVNPFTVYLDGIYFLAQNTGMADLERARVSFERVRGMGLDVPGMDEDLAMIERLMAGQPPEPVTYVLFETGMAPEREETRIDIPLFVVSRSVPYVGVAFPVLKFNSAYVPRLTVRSGGQSLDTRLVCSMDSVVAREFDNDLPVVITRTLISAGTKALAQYGLYEATKDSGTLGTLVLIAGTVYQAAMNQADLRTWITLPKQFQALRIPTPPDRRLTLTPAGYPGTVDVLLQPGLVNIVYAKSNSNRAPLRVTQFVLRPAHSTGPIQ